MAKLFQLQHPLSFRQVIESGKLVRPIFTVFIAGIRVNNPNCTRGGYFDFAAFRQLSDQLRLDSSVDTLLDKEYFEAIGFPAMGQRARLAIDWRF